MKIFKELGLTSKGKVLSYDDFSKKSDWKNLSVSAHNAEKIIAKAEEYLEEPIPMLTLSMYHDFFVSGSRNPFVNEHIKRRDMLLHFVIAEHIEKKGRFMSKLCDALWSILEETTWVIPAHVGHNPTYRGDEIPPVYNESDMHGVDLYAANTASCLAFMLLYLRDELDAFSPILVERTEYELEKRIIKPFISLHPTYSGEYGEKCNNWVTHVVECVLFAIAVVERRMHVREAAVEKSMRYLDNYMKWMPDDGGCDEGPGYWNGAGASYFIGLEIIYDMTDGAVNVFDNQIIRNMGEYIYKFNINGERYINFADCSPIVHPDGHLIKRYGERCGSEGMVAFGKMLIAENPYSHIFYSHGYRLVRDLGESPITDATVTKAEKYVWFPDLKVMVARESEDTSKGLFLAIKGGHNKQSHNHNDVGSYIIYKDGNPVVIDPGATTYVRDTFGPNRYTIWNMQSHYHNLPAFDGIGQHNGLAFASSREEYNPETHVLTLGLEKAFRRDAGVESYTRCASLNDALIEIGEEISLDEEREIDFRLIVIKTPEVIGEGKLLLSEGVTLEYDTRLEYTCEEFDPIRGEPLKKWGTEFLYRLHFTIRAKDLNCKFIFK